MWLKRRRRIAVLLGTVQLMSACYSYVPVSSAPPVGSRVALEINDDGRVALRDLLGPGIARVEGTLSSVTGDRMVVQASSLTQIRGRAVTVDSLSVPVTHGYIERMDERRFSRTRTMIAVGTAVAVVAAFFVTKGATGRGTPPEDPPGEPPVNQFRGLYRAFNRGQ